MLVQITKVTTTPKILITSLLNQFTGFESNENLVLIKAHC